MADKKVTDTQGKEVKDGVVDSPVLHSSLHDADSPDPGKVKVVDAEGNVSWVWPVDAKEISAIAGQPADLSTKIPEDATRPTVDQAIETLLPPTQETQDAEDDGGKSLRGKLPEDFPGYAAFVAAGHTTYAKVRRLRDGGKLTSVSGIGDATAAQVEEALKE
jgi:hypothetical protein